MVEKKRERRPSGRTASRGSTPSLRDCFAGKRVLITGVTGFLGQAVFERFLLEFDETSIVLLVRPQHGASGRRRVETVMRRPLFDALREREGGDEGIVRLLDERVEVVEGDFTVAPPAFPDDLDVVIHCAATVSFDPPIDEGFQTNLLGTVQLYEAVRDSGSHPHLIHVSTAYVAGTTKGIVPEDTLAHRVDWRTEADLAVRARGDVEAASRRPEQLDRFMADARKEHSRAGPQTVAADAEQRRRDWVTKRLVQYG